MKLIDNWRQGWRMFSVQAQAIALAILGAWQVMPQDMKAQIPGDLVYWLAMGLMVLGIIGRLVQQPGVQKDAMGAPILGKTEPPP